MRPTEYLYLFKELRGCLPEVGSKNLIKNKVRSNYANPPYSAGGALKSLSKPNKNAGPSHTVTSEYLLVVFLYVTSFRCSYSVL